MVRLVFRPYTQVRKAICTSAHLRASTRVSSGFTLLRHSSPSFGSQQVRSYSNLSQKIMVGRWCRQSHPTSQFPCAYGFATRQLAYMLDSLVRVSRRAHWAPYTSILRTQLDGGAPFVPRSRPRHRPSTERGFSRGPNPCWPAHVRQVR